MFCIFWKCQICATLSYCLPLNCTDAGTEAVVSRHSSCDATASVIVLARWKTRARRMRPDGPRLVSRGINTLSKVSGEFEGMMDCNSPQCEQLQRYGNASFWVLNTEAKKQQRVHCPSLITWTHSRVSGICSQHLLFPQKSGARGLPF